MTPESSNGIRIVAINGSVRPGNYTGKALALVVDELENKLGVAVDLFEPSKMNLPAPGIGLENPDTTALKAKVKAATGVILSTPEYHGGLSSVIKLAIENLGFPSMLATKPVALLGVAAGTIGAIKSLEQLRSICSHIGAIVLPGPVSVANVQGVFNEDGTITDPKVEKRIRGLAHSLVDYINDSVCPKLSLEKLVRE